MTKITFLGGKSHLVKTIYMHKGKIDVRPYPNVLNFTSYEEQCATLKELHTAIVAHSKLGHCLLKGIIKAPLKDESRAGSTTTEDLTDWMCLDLDKAPFSKVSDLMDNHPLLKDVSYIVQYSASHGLPGRPKNTISCHVFMLLDGKVRAPYLKAWLMQQNLDGKFMNGEIRRAITLTEHKSALHYPIDATACQNDKLLFIAPPVVKDNIKYVQEPISYVAKPLGAMPVERVTKSNLELWKKEALVVRNELRKQEGLDPINTKTRIIDGFEVQKLDGEFVITGGPREDNGFVRFNFNDGDSWAYYHPVGNFEYIHSFKQEPSYKTKEILPGYYKQCQLARKREQLTPTEEGNQILAICDKRSGAYHKVAWNAAEQELQMYPASSDKQLNDWLLSHNKFAQEFVPQWDLEFNPQNEIICDVASNYLNTYVPSPWSRLKRTPNIEAINKCPTIKRILAHVLSEGKWNDVTDHFINWLACIIQYRVKTGTAWVLHGTEGTGKGVLVNTIIRKLVGHEYVVSMTQRALENQFNGYIERALVVLFDEMEINASMNKAMTSGELRDWITEEYVPIRHMRMAHYSALNFANFIFASNKEGPVQINDHDRRYNIAEYQKNKIVITEKDIRTLIPAELGHFYDYLMAYNADRERARKVIHTKARREVIVANRNSVDMMTEALLDGDIEPYVEVLPDMQVLAELHGTGTNSTLALSYSNIISREMEGLLKSKQTNREGNTVFESKLTRDELWVLLEYSVGGMPVSPAKLTRLLKHKHIETKRMRAANGDMAYGITVRWVATKDWIKDHTVVASNKVVPIRRKA
jgi:hypothetical protein